MLDRLVARRTSVINQIRAFLLERGISFRRGPVSLRRQMPEILENADQILSTRMRHLLNFLWQERKGLQWQIESLNADLEEIASSDATCVRRGSTGIDSGRIGFSGVFGVPAGSGPSRTSYVLQHVQRWSSAHCW